VYNDHVNTYMSYEDFNELYHKCWQQKYGFLVIDKDSALTNGRYRKGFNEFAVRLVDIDTSTLKERQHD